MPFLDIFYDIKIKNVMWSYNKGRGLFNLKSWAFHVY